MSNLFKKTFSFSVFGNNYYFTPKFTLATLITILLFIGLGIWQLERAAQITQLIKTINFRLNLTPISINELKESKDWRFVPIGVQGVFDNEHQILLDKRTYQGQAGYDVITPFKIPGSAQALLVDRGWISIQQATSISPVTEGISISGVLVQPDVFAFADSAFNEQNPQWPLIIQQIDFERLSIALGYPLYPYIVLLSPNNPYGFVRKWQNLAARLTPEKNEAYAMQWFGLAFVTFVLFLVLNIQRGGQKG